MDSDDLTVISEKIYLSTGLISTVLERDFCVTAHIESITCSSEKNFCISSL
jgi:hypothetical protein